MAVLVADLIDQSKALADKRGDGSVPDTDWLTYVRWSVKSLDRFIASLDAAFRFAHADFALTSTPAGSKVDLSTLTWTMEQSAGNPAGPFVALHGLDKDPDTTTRRTIPRRNFRERNTGRISSWLPAIYDRDRRYDLRARMLFLTPYEQAAGSYRAYARLGPYLFVSTTDPVALDWQLEPYDEWLVIMTARKGLGIEETETGLQSERLQELREEIMSEHTRDDGEATVIADVEEDGYDRGF